MITKGTAEDLARAIVTIYREGAQIAEIAQRIRDFSIIGESAIRDDYRSLITRCKAEIEDYLSRTGRDTAYFNTSIITYKRDAQTDDIVMHIKGKIVPVELHLLELFTDAIIAEELNKK